MSINVGEIILKEIQDCAMKKGGKNVEQLNQIEPNEPKFDEPLTKSKLEVDSVNEIEEAKFEGELNSLKPRVEPNNPEARVEPNIAKLVEPSVNPKLTIPMPTSSNTMKNQNFQR
ncbi:hypothetical protein PVK06_040065 [Gossypium arboreum]|uniref:Uncharacterized protein n=1 Tax=Gossypium arboreum TaxID=29729 RepID=A0ABR0N6L9_GOSAR|nr:hypothetical protein PVK06_040065 [Gossypium arboreum]